MSDLRFLTPDQLESFNTNGFLLLPNVIPLAETQQLKEQAIQLMRQWNQSQLSIFTTINQAQSTDQYFYDSASNISFFVEEDPSARERLEQSNELGINKIGHALHDLDPVFEQFSYRKEYRDILADLGYQDPVIVQSMYIVKPPQIGGVVNKHQDASFIMSEPASCIGIWCAIEDARQDNACLWAIPGSHRAGTKAFFVKDGDNMRYDQAPVFDEEGGVCIEAPAGSVVLIHRDVIHWSDINRSDRSRHAYSLHVVETRNTIWKSENWLQRPNFPFKPWPLVGINIATAIPAFGNKKLITYLPILTLGSYASTILNNMPSSIFIPTQVPISHTNPKIHKIPQTPQKNPLKSPVNPPNSSKPKSLN